MTVVAKADCSVPRTVWRSINGVSSFFDQGRNLLRVGEEDGMTTGKLDRVRLGSARHEALKFRVDHAILLGDYRIAGLLRPCGDCCFGSEGLNGDRDLRDRHETS